MPFHPGRRFVLPTSAALCQALNALERFQDRLVNLAATFDRFLCINAFLTDSGS